MVSSETKSLSDKRQAFVESFRVTMNGLIEKSLRGEKWTEQDRLEWFKKMCRVADMFRSPRCQID